MSGTVFLREKGGLPIGPLPLLALEVLFSVRVVDEETPVSLDGADFRPLAERPELLARLLSARERVVAGDNPWPEGVKPAPFRGVINLSQESPLRVLFRVAIAGARGRLVIEAAAGEVHVLFSDGKILAVDTSAEPLSLGRWLLDQKVVGMPALEKAVLKSIELGGDLGAALIATGAVPPHVYLEQFVQWSRRVLEAVIAFGDGRAHFQSAELPPPAVPLGLDRFGGLLDLARKALKKDDLERRLGLGGARAVIPSQVEGLNIDGLKLPPKELRVLKGIDGAKTLSAILEAQTPEQKVAAMFALYVALEIGFAVLGEDPESPKERLEAERLRELLETWKKKSHFEILTIRAESSDEEVRNRYMDLAKIYHPDRVRAAADPALIDVRRSLFTLVQAAYEATDSPEKRAAQRDMAKMGFAGKVDEQAVVRAVLESETFFRKAEALGRMKKYAEALEHIDQAIKRNDEPEFRMHRAYFSYHANPTEAAAQRALDEIALLLKKNPTLASGQLFLARLNKALHRPEVAMKHFKKLLELDPRNHEAESELRLFAMRQDKSQKKKWF